MSDASMNCQNCDAPVLVSDERCEKCGAKLLHRRVILGTNKPENFALTAEEEPSELDEPAQDDEWHIPPRAELASDPRAVVAQNDAVAKPRYGGFWRRVGAFIVDLAVIFLLTALMAVMAFIGYKVGLAAHDRSISLANAAPLVAFLTFACVFLATVYFVVFHGMDGTTIGKSLLGLRVVAADQSSINYRRALLRWVGLVGFGCLTIGVSFLWIMWSREKRGWHDFLARTWVIRE
jgi:uncharacterized RDD family membrane protein YckC